MRLDNGTLILTENESKVYSLLSNNKTQAEIAIELSFSRPYINQLVKKLESFGAIIPIAKNQNGNKREYVHHYNKTELDTISEVITLDIKSETQDNKQSIKRSSRNTYQQKCLYCKRKITSKTHKYQKFCSRSCRGKFQSGPRSSAWKGGKTYEPYCYKFNEDLKERVRDFFERECFLCGAGEIEKAHSVHHIDYNKMACCDGDNEALLVPLCEACHNRTSPLTKDRSFWERMLYHQLMQRTGGKCFLTHKEVLIIEHKQKRGQN
jgi:predicted transcriptional regulator